MEVGFGLSHPAACFFHNWCVFNASHLSFGSSRCSHSKANAVGVTHWRPERQRRLGKKRPFKHERQKGVWSGFERDLVTCSPYVSTFHQLYSDLKQVASLPNKPQLFQHLLRCNLSCQRVKNPYMGQNRDRLTQVVSEGKKMVWSAPYRRAAGVKGPFGAVFLARCHSQLDLLSAFTMSKTLILTFLFAPAEVPWKSLSVRLSRCLTGLPCFQVRSGSGLGASASR